MTEYVITKDVAKLVRQALRGEFPGVKFSVTCGTGTGSSWIRVAYTDGPEYDAVRELAWCYEGRRFDGMTDSYNTQPTSLIVFEGEELPREVHFHCDGINVERNISADAEAWAARLIADEHGEVQKGDIIEVAGVRVYTNYGVDYVARELAYKLDLRGVDFAGVAL